MKRLSLSIKNSLLLILFVLSALVLASSLVAWLAFSRVSSTQELLLNTSLPTIRLADSAVKTGTELLNIGLALSQPLSVDELVSYQNRIRPLVDQINSDMQAVSLALPESVEFQSFSVSQQQLISTINNQILAQQDYISNNQRLENEILRIQALIDGALIRVKLISTDISLRIANLTDKQGKFLYFQLAGIQELRFILQNMKLVVDELRVYSDAREIERQEDLYRQKIRKIATLFLELENNYQQQLSTYLDALNQQVVNDQGLFVLAINKSAFVGLLEGYRERNIQLSQQLSDIYRNLLNQSNSRLDRDASDLLTLMENSKWILLIAALIAVIVCFIFYQFFVKPHITDRILLLANNTNAIADGEYGFEIDTSGSDEVARMARSLDYFRSELMEKETVQIDLADREKMLSTIVDNAMVGLFTVDLKGKILSFNNVCERIFHTTSENAMDISINHFFPESDALFSTHTRRAVSAEGESFTIVNESDLAARCVDGHIFTANLSLSLINLSGRNIYSGFIRDVTTERQSRDRIETLINQLMQSNSDLERFAYSCSHDLQEPVRMVLSFSELLQQHLSDSIDEKTSKYLNFIHLGANNAKDLIRDILEYSRLGKTDTHKKWVNIATLADKVKANIAILLEEKGAVFLCESGDIEIYVVESQMLQLITNLLVNGIKYNKSEVPKVVLTIAEQKQYWQLTIADNGIGIDKRYHERIFDVFNRLVNKNEYSGSGIGLAICKKVVENHQGKIWVESDGCNGSQFHVQLPKSKIAG